MIRPRLVAHDADGDPACPHCGRPVTAVTLRHRCVCRHTEGRVAWPDGHRAWVEPDGTLVLMMGVGQ